MYQSEKGSDAAVNPLFEMELQVDAEDNLRHHEEEKGCGGLCVDVVWLELATTVEVAESVAEQSECGAEYL
jgi:hypothetical protein